MNSPPAESNKPYYQAFNPGELVGVPTKPGLFLTDVHGGTVYRGDTASWLVSLDHRVPFIGFNGNGSQSMPDVVEALTQRQRAAASGLFASRKVPGANYDAAPMEADPSLPLHRFAIGDHVPGVPLGLTSNLGHGGGR
jgi:hypothetical protein